MINSQRNQSDGSLEKQIGEKITLLRKRFGVKQRDLARYLNVTVSTISHYESGTNVPNVNILVQLAEYFGVSVDYILGNTELNLDWNTFNREITLESGEKVSLQSIVNSFIELSEKSQADIYRLIKLFLMDERMTHSEKVGDGMDEKAIKEANKSIEEWLN